MAFSDLTIADAAATNVVFRPTSVASGKTIYSDASRGVLEPRTLTVAHQKSGSKDAVRIRTLVRVDDTQTNTDGTDTAALSAYLVIDRPGKVVSAGDIKNAIALVKNLLTAANIDTLIVGQQL